VAARNKREDHDDDENKFKVCIIPAMTSTSEKTQPLEIETTSTPRPGIWSFRVTTISDSWTEASFVHTTFECEVITDHFPSLFPIYVHA
jgi:hypothetical protein